MGNWRTVQLIGTVSDADLAALQSWVNTGLDWDRFHPLCNPGPSLYGIGAWADQTTIAKTGNLAERDYSVDDVAAALKAAVGAAPSLTLKVHCGDDWEDLTCVASITVADQQVTVDDPEIESLKPISDLTLVRLEEIIVAGRSPTLFASADGRAVPGPHWVFRGEAAQYNRPDQAGPSGGSR